MPAYVASEYAKLEAALDVLYAADAAEVDEGERRRCFRLASEAAADLARQVQVTRAQEKDLSQQEILLATHQVLVDIRAELQALNSRVASVERRVQRCSAAAEAAADAAHVARAAAESAAEAAETVVGGGGSQAASQADTMSDIE